MDINRVELAHSELTGMILGCSFEIMKELGAGFLESVYENALCIALQQEGLSVQQQVPIEVFFRKQVVGKYVADLFVGDKVLVELKAVKTLLPEHQAQTINYLKATGIEVGLLINFGNPKLEFKRLFSRKR